MIICKKLYFLIIENIKDIDLRKIKKRKKFSIIYRVNDKIDKIEDLTRFRNKCRAKQITFYVANNLDLAILLKSDGIYLSAKNQSFKVLNLNKLNLKIIGSAHNQKEIYLKVKQGCGYIFLSRLFNVSYKPEMDYLGINKFNNYSINHYKKLIPLGGINIITLNKLKSIKSEGLAILTEIKKKPAIISRLF